MQAGNVIILRDREPYKWDGNIVPTIFAYGPTGIKDRKRLLEMFKGYNKMAMRHFWDNCGEDSFYHGKEGSFDCADIHSYMNMTGDGGYCAV